MKGKLKKIVPDLKEVASEETPRVDSIRMDANIEKTIQELFEEVQSALDGIFPDSTLRKWAKAMVGGVNKKAKKNTAKAAKSVGLDIEPMLTDKGLNPFFENMVDQNVGLIRSIPKEKLESFKNQLVAMITEDQTSKTIWEAIEKNFDVSKSRARLIARDQVGKINSQMDQYRQQQLGAKRYIWRTVEDERVREDHQKLDGKVFSWSKPPIENRKTGNRDHPGRPINCRCYAESYLDDILD